MLCCVFPTAAAEAKAIAEAEAAKEKEAAEAGAKVATEAPKQRDRRLLVGTWLYADDDSFEIHEEDGNLMRGSFVLVEEGDYMVKTYSDGDCERYKLGPS